MLVIIAILLFVIACAVAPSIMGLLIAIPFWLGLIALAVGAVGGLIYWIYSAVNSEPELLWLPLVLLVGWGLWNVAGKLYQNFYFVRLGVAFCAAFISASIATGFSLSILESYLDDPLLGKVPFFVFAITLPFALRFWIEDANSPTNSADPAIRENS